MSPRPSPYTVVVAGGAGAMGRITVRDLLETAPTAQVVVADYNLRAAKTLVAELDSPRVKAARLDVTDIAATTRLLKRAFAVVCAVQYQHNVSVMRAALAARTHYVDLGGLFHVTRQQLALHHDFERVDRLALLGMGAAPGLTNMLASWGAEGLDRVDEIALFVAGVDQTRMQEAEGFGTSYSIQTILEEASKPAAFFTGGKMTFVPPMSGGLLQRFPPPVGAQTPHMTLHSEVATLPDSYRHKGVRQVSFRIAFDAETTSRLRFLHLLGLTGDKPVQVGDVAVRPMDLLMRLLGDAPKPRPAGPPKGVEVLRAVVTGKRGRARAGYVAECHVTGMPRWGVGIDIDTGCPPSIAVQMLAGGAITARGVLPPERAVPLPALREALARRGMHCRRRVLAAARRAKS